MSCSIIAEYLNFNSHVNDPTVAVIDRKKNSNCSMTKATNSYYDLCKSDQYTNECHEISFSPNLENNFQTRLYCVACSEKLYHKGQRYFAFDKEYCPNCWRSISFKLVNSYP